MKSIVFALILFFSCSIFSQKSEIAFSLIPDSLKQNANAIVRLDQMDIIISSQREMNIKKKIIVTVLNENGKNAIGATESYDKRTSVKRVEASIFDSFGTEIKNIKKKDFKDQCVIDGVTLFSDNRILYLDYTPTQYPYTVIYESEIKTSNTAFIPRWYFLNRYNTGVQKGVLNVYFPDDLGFKKKEFNFSNFSIQKLVDSPTQLSYAVNGIVAQKPEPLSLEFYKIFPWVLMGLEHFNLEGVDGYVKSWKEFGQWYTDKILYDTNELPEATKLKMIELVGTEKEPLQKARIIYNYLQQKSRYVSVQVGIGGFKPMLAKDVDRLGYGDCKALTNYTQALLKAVNVTSYPVLLYGDRKKMDIESDIASVQGNHMILAIAAGSDYTFLECTSQDIPFGYLANFTDDRNVLVLKPDGGELVKTKSYLDKDNAQYSVGNYTIEANGNLTGTISIASEGTQYGFKYDLESKSLTETEAHYKEYWNNINNLKLNLIAFSNDKSAVRFTENLKIDADNYGTLLGDKLLFPVNVFNTYSANLKRLKNRKTPFEIPRGSYDADEISITLPSGFSLEFVPEKVALTSKFGEYSTEIIKINDNTLVFNRKLLIKNGNYKNSEYEEYRLFLEQIARNDNAKIILAKNQ